MDRVTPARVGSRKLWTAKQPLGMVGSSTQSLDRNGHLLFGFCSSSIYRTALCSKLGVSEVCAQTTAPRPLPFAVLPTPEPRGRCRVIEAQTRPDSPESVPCIHKCALLTNTPIRTLSRVRTNAANALSHLRQDGCRLEQKPCRRRERLCAAAFSNLPGPQQSPSACRRIRCGARRPGAAGLGWRHRSQPWKRHV